MLVWLIIIAGIVFIDQLTKWLTVINLDLYESVTVIKGFLNFKYVRNTGAAFSLFDKPDERWIFMSISTVAIIAMFVYLWHNRKGDKLLCVALSFIVGGGLGNMVDRTLLGYVVDFLDFIIWRTPEGREVHFATFNVADSFVCVGVGLFALAVILEEVREYKKSRAAKLGAVAENGEAPSKTVEPETEENEENDTEAD